MRALLATAMTLLGARGAPRAGEGRGLAGPSGPPGWGVDWALATARAVERGGEQPRPRGWKGDGAGWA